jgi:cytochrome c peroxidase
MATLESPEDHPRQLPCDMNGRAERHDFPQNPSTIVPIQPSLPMKLARPSRRTATIALFTCAGLLGVGLVTANDTDGALLERARGLFKPLPHTAHVDDYPHSAARVELGRKLFFETRVSTDGRTSCATCHSPSHYGADSLPTSVGVHGRLMPRNAQTVFNTPLLVAQHYGGNRVSVEEQAWKALTSALAYGNKTFEEAEIKLRELGYTPLFAEAFPNEKEPVSAEHWAVAIGAYERTLLTPAPFDRYLKGDQRAISADAKRGLDKFMNVGCAGCHSGSTVGGQSFQKFGLTEDYWKATGSVDMPAFKGRDMGRFHDTGKEEDKWIFKVPQLRNVAMTPPYFHDGSVAKLDDAVRIMARLQLGRELPDQDVNDIVAFLQTLTGEIPPQFAQVPALPVAPFRPTPKP